MAIPRMSLRASGAPRSESKFNNCQWQLLHSIGGSRFRRKRETDEGYLPLPMGEVPPEGGGEGEFTLSVTS